VYYIIIIDIVLSPLFFVQDSDVKGAAAGATQEAKSNIDSAVSDFIGKF